jgi:hypothetical protein
MRQTEHRATAAAAADAHGGLVPDDVAGTWTLLHSSPHPPQLIGDGGFWWALGS